MIVISASSSRHNSSQTHTVDALCVVFGPVTAVGDIHGVDTLNYSKDEKVTRGKIAACYRLADINGWSHGLDGYITVSQLLAQISLLYDATVCSQSLECNCYMSSLCLGVGLPNTARRVPA